jgi:hypothetical protein
MRSNDAEAFALTDGTIVRTPQDSRCVYCNAIRLWNADECIHCALEYRRRAVRALLFIVAIVAVVVVVAVLIEPIPPARLIP